MRGSFGAHPISISTHAPLRNAHEHGEDAVPAGGRRRHRRFRGSGAGAGVRSGDDGPAGAAGPGGAVPGKPVGTVWFALAHSIEDRLECQGHLIQFDGDRDAVRRQAVQYALNLLKALPPIA